MEREKKGKYTNIVHHTLVKLKSRPFTTLIRNNIKFTINRAVLFVNKNNK